MQLFKPAFERVQQDDAEFRGRFLDGHITRRATLRRNVRGADSDHMSCVFDVKHKVGQKSISPAVNDADLLS
jgi:hypothetical protein